MSAMEGAMSSKFCDVARGIGDVIQRVTPSHALSSLLIHLVFGTKNRQPLITLAITIKPDGIDAVAIA